MPSKDDLLESTETWYKGSSVRDFLARILAAREAVSAWYEASRTQQTDGSFLAKYFVCTGKMLLVLIVSASQIEVRAYPLAGLQKLTFRTPYDPGHVAIWPRTELTCRFLVGTEPERVQVDFPQRDDQIPGFFSVVQNLLFWSGRNFPA
jgi:hypothetical protein